MHAQRVSAITRYRQADAPGWLSVATEQIRLVPTPIGLQPTDHIRVNWQNQPYGRVGKILVAIIHDGNDAAIRLQWRSEQKHPKDAVAVALPVRGRPALATMGAEHAPVHFLHWIAGQGGLRSVVATGIGTTREGPRFKTSVASSWEKGEWRVVVVRPLGSGGGIAPLFADAKTGIGFAVWEGANDERAGIKAFSIDWQELTFAA